MKLKLSFLPLFLCGFIRIATGQQKIQFIYVGSEKYYESIVITSGHLPEDPEGKDLSHKKIYYADQRSFDTLKAYILRSDFVNLSDVPISENGKIDTLKLLDAYKIIAADSDTLFIAGHNCFKLFSSSEEYLAHVGLSNTVAWYAVRHLMFQCHEEFLDIDRNKRLKHTIGDTLHIDPNPRIKVKQNIQSQPSTAVR
jgi:hypothetical protein